MKRGQRAIEGTERRRVGRGQQRRHMAKEEIKGLEGQRAVAGTSGHRGDRRL